jgi:hypothetical protein
MPTGVAFEPDIAGPTIVLDAANRGTATASVHFSLVVWLDADGLPLGWQHFDPRGGRVAPGGSTQLEAHPFWPGTYHGAAVRLSYREPSI